MFRVLVLCLVICCERVSARETITWLTEDTQPLYLSSGVDAGSGFADQQLHLAIENLPDFNHRIVKADSARILHDLTHRDGACAINWVVSPIRRFLLAFSHRSIALPGYRLVIQTQRIHEFEGYLTATQEIDLAKLDAGKTMSGVVESGRAYPDVIASVINDPGRATHLAVASQARALMSMVARRRVDFSFATQIELDNENRSLPANQKLQGLPILGVPRTLLTKVACSNDPLGSAVIEALDAWLSDDGNWRRFLEPVRRWIDDDTFRLNLGQQ